MTSDEKRRRTRSPRSSVPALSDDAATRAMQLRVQQPRKDGDASRFVLRLYIAGRTPKCVAAFENLKRICEKNLQGRYRIEVIDLLENPQLARGDQILAVPTLVRKLPTPVKKIIGNLSNEERVLVGLDLRPLAREVS